MDPTIRLQKCLAPEGVRIKTHHNRQPDVGTGILVSVWDSPGEKEEYYGVKFTAIFSVAIVEAVLSLRLP